MSDNNKNIIITIAFALLLILFLLVNLLKPDAEISLTERRKLAKFPEVSVRSVFDSSFSKNFEKYTTDQVVGRDKFRKLKSDLELNLFRKNDNNNIYMYNNSFIKIEYPLNEISVLYTAKKINEIKEKFLGNMTCYYTIIPDKNYFTDKEKYIYMDYEKLQSIMAENIEDIEYINIFDCLELEDYYVTDIHWKQESLQKVVDEISTKMNFKNRLSMPFEKKDVIQFNGIYAKELPFKVEPDRISILTNDIIQNAKVYNYENKKETKVYDMEKLDSPDKYDIYLSGAIPIITITNSNSKENKELIVFRDSFGSSLVPLFTEAYSKITLVDIRYMRSKDLEEYIEFKDQEVLFLYSTLILNNSSVLK